MAPRRSVELAASLSGIARTLLAAQDVDDTLRRIVAQTLRLIEPAEHAGTMS